MERFLSNAAAGGLYILSWVIVINYAAQLIAAKHPSVETTSFATAVAA